MTKSDIDKGRKLFSQPCKFLLSAPTSEGFPASSLPEVAFIGRSNAGKSSLINALTHRKDLARTSNTPGRTQHIVFFDLGDRLMLADLPGYGHADAPRQEKERWNELVHHYLQTRPTLRCVCLLLDARHGILAKDLVMMQFLDRAACSYKLVLTKADQIHATEQGVKQTQTEAALGQHPAARPGVLITSSKKAEGIEELRAFLAGFAAEA
ncbi:MAG: ribosome biogenesis GTP-binding protein YihA/YsxC [Alphaproteobacteria bacterium]|nr:ribosome biogenesis GTP-binding protein YihA/YsxC [Alphaproteobacteria bacterium]